MWILILTLQFFVYMATWNIRYTRVMKFVLHELRKISLGEFLDDLEIGGNILRLLGINSGKKSVTEEVVGEDRLGSRKDIFANFGSTLILASIGMLVVIIAVCTLIILLRRVKCSKKCKENFQKLKKALFWNPLIRYIVINSLKLNISTIVIFKAAQSTEAPSLTNILGAVGISLLVNIFAIIFFCILQKK